MIVRGRLSLLVILTLVLTACATTWQTEQPVTPSSYQTTRERIPRTVGKLRKLMVLPIRRNAPKVCRGDGEITIDYDDANYTAAAEYLATQKGYEVMRLDTARNAAWLNPEQNRDSLLEITEWFGKKNAHAIPGPLTGELLRNIRTADAADGLLIFVVQMDCKKANTPMRTINAVLSLGISELPYDYDAFLPRVIFRISILETAESRPVWGKYHSRDWSGKTDEEYLFEDLEPAVPKILTH